MTWPFRRRRPPAPALNLTEGAYDRWLRAHRPPFEWFLGLPPEHQEALASLGDTHSLRLALTDGHAARDPAGVEMAARAVEGDPAGEAGLAAQLAEAVLEKHASDAAAAAAASRVPTMAGVFERPETPDPRRGPTLFGQEADRRVNPLQMAMQIRHLLRAAVWPAFGGQVVFGDRNVYVTAGPPSVDLIPETFPMAFVQIGSGTPDEENPGELIEQTFTIATAVSVMGDRRGEFALIGGHRTDVTASAGAGIGEVEERVRNALEELTGADGARVILGTSSLGVSKGTIGNGAHLAWSEIEVTATCTSQFAYAAPQELAIADGTWTWNGAPCSSRYDFLQYRLGYIAQSAVPVELPGAATEIVYTGAAATTTIARQQGAVYMIWADYTHRDDSSIDGSSSGLERGAYL